MLNVPEQARTHPVVDTFVADGRNGDLLFCCYVVTQEGVGAPVTTGAAFTGMRRRTSLAMFGGALSNPRCADTASRRRALSAHGGFPDQAAL